MGLRRDAPTLEYGSKYFCRSYRRPHAVLTESQVERSFRQLISAHGLVTETFDKAEELLEELRPESPLRHRLGSELEELRDISAPQ